MSMGPDEGIGVPARTVRDGRTKSRPGRATAGPTRNPPRWESPERPRPRQPSATGSARPAPPFRPSATRRAASTDVRVIPTNWHRWRRGLRGSFDHGERGGRSVTFCRVVPCGGVPGLFPGIPHFHFGCRADFCPRERRQRSCVIASESDVASPAKAGSFPPHPATAGRFARATMVSFITTSRPR